MKTACLLLCAALLLGACTSDAGPWEAFIRCGTNHCVPQALAVKEALLANPADILSKFQATAAKGDDHVTGWIYLMRDSVLYNIDFGSTEMRFDLQQRIVAAAAPFENDPKLGDVAKSIVEVIGTLAIASELEEEIPEITQPFTGSFAFELPDDGGAGAVKIAQISMDSIRFALEVVGNKPAHNQGSIEGTALMMALDSAVFSTSEFGNACQLAFVVIDGAVQVRTLRGDPSDCGFGNNVRADGIYRRSSFDNPFLKPADAQKAQKLLGAWQSDTDSTLTLTIADGMYTETHKGEHMGSMLYVYFPKCPKDCSSVATGPCLKVIAQDEVCFTVVKADGKTLQLSQIGGTGNTLSYTRK